MTESLKDPTKEIRDCCYIEEDEDIGPHSIRVRHLITKDHKITIYRDYENNGDIFDRKGDPNEINNLWDQNEQLRCKLVQKMAIETLKAIRKFPDRVSPT